MSPTGTIVGRFPRTACIWAGGAATVGGFTVDMLIDLELTSHGLMIILRKWHTTQPELDIMTSPIRSIILSFEPLASIEALRL